MKYNNKISQSKVKPSKLILGQYTDDWQGCSKLVNDLSKYFIEMFDYSKKMKIKDYAKLIEIEYRDDTIINPSFYPLIDSVLGFAGITRNYSNKWLMLKERRESEDKIYDTKQIGWVNVNSVYPNYENKGVIAINSLDTASKIKHQGKEVYVSGDNRHWTADIANVLSVINEFSSNEFTLEPHEKRAIKYMAGEILANTFQHAFDKEGRSDIGMFLNEETKVLMITINDRGLSIPGNIRKRMSNNKISKKSDSWLIEWALGRGNTSKEKERQGGMGLYRVKTILDNAEGEFAIRSLTGILHNVNGSITKTRNYYKNFGTITYMKVDLGKIKKEDLEIPKEIWDEVKGVFI